MQESVIDFTLYVIALLMAFNNRKTLINQGFQLCVIGVSGFHNMIHEYISQSPFMGFQKI